MEDRVDRLRQEYLVSYDVEDNKARTALYKELKGFGLRGVQKSVFWGYLTMAELHAVKRSLHKYLNGLDRGFVVRSQFNGQGQSYFVGHSKEDFEDWEECNVI